MTGTEPDTPFGRALRQAIASSRYNQTTLAAAIGIERGTLSRYISGVRTPDVDMVHEIEQALGVPLAGHLNYRSIFDAAPDGEIAIAASGVDLEELRRRDPEAYDQILGLARIALDRARDRDPQP